MLNTLFRLALTFNATFMVVLVFFVQKKYTLFKIVPHIRWLSDIPDFFSYIIYIVIILIFTYIVLSMSKFSGVDSFSPDAVDSIECANNSFMPNYLGYFFVSTGISDECTFVIVYLIIFVFTFSSRSIYFNPLFLIFGYSFYTIKTKKGSVVSLVSSRSYKNPSEVDIKKVHRINDYTFIERG